MKSLLRIFVFMCMALVAGTTGFVVCAAEIPVDDSVFGWAVCSSSTAADDFCLVGSDNGSLVVLSSNGDDMAGTVEQAMRDYDVVVLDGSRGDFCFSRRAVLSGLSRKMLVGINGATISTKFKVSDDIKHLLDSLNVGALSANSADGRGGTLPNGMVVAEEREYNIRLALIDMYGNNREDYRLAGGFEMNGCSNMVIRNLVFDGPGSLDVGGYDLLTISESQNVWIDHCRFTDGLDGNLDIISGSNLITVSWCVFDYTDRSYNHSLSNLISGKDGVDEDNLNITWAFCRWGNGCTARLPWVHYGLNHVMCCHYASAQAECVSASDGARLLVENCVFDTSVRRVYADKGTGAAAITWRGNIHPAHSAPAQRGAVEVPYAYTTVSADIVPELLAKNAGATLDQPIVRRLSFSTADIDAGTLYSGIERTRRVNINRFVPGAPATGFCFIETSKGITLSTDGVDFSNEVSLPMADILSQDLYIKLQPEATGDFNGTIKASYAGETVELPVHAIVQAAGALSAVTQAVWPFDNGDANNRTCECSIANVFAPSWFATGANLFFKGTTVPNGGSRMSMLNPVQSIGKRRHADSYVCFSLQPDSEFSFVPEWLSFDACRVGTDMSAIDVVVCSDSETTTLLSGVTPQRSGTGDVGYSSYRLDLSEVRLSERYDIYIYIYYLNNNKQVAIGNIRVGGSLYTSESGIVAVEADIDTDTVHYYNMQGIELPRPLPGQRYIKVTIPSR